MSLKNSYFYDKRDNDYYTINADEIFYYDMFTKKKLKCKELIPETLCLKKGFPYFWIFNSKKDPRDTSILKKNTDNLNDFQILNKFLNLRVQNDQSETSILLIKQFLEKNQKEAEKKGFFCKLRSGKSQIVSKMQAVDMFMDKKQLVFYQIRNNTYQITCRPAKYFFKKVKFFYANKEETFKHNSLNINMQKKSFTIKKLSDDSEQVENYEDSSKAHEYDHKYYKLIDKSITKKLEQITHSIVEHILNGFKVLVKKFVGKFIQDVNGQIYFIGAKELLVDIPQITNYNKNNLRNKLQNQISLSELNKYQKIQKELLQLDKIKQQSQNNQKNLPPLSNKPQSARVVKHSLYKTQCKGDFCNYKVTSDQSQTYLIRSHQQDFQKAKELQLDIFLDIQKNTTDTNQGHTISNQLILRSRECFESVLKVIKQNNIIPEDGIDSFSNQYSHLQQNTKKQQSFISLYKMVKICKNCFKVYNLISQNFQQNLDIEMSYHHANNKLQTTLTTEDSMIKKTEVSNITLDRKKTQSARMRNLKVNQAYPVQTFLTTDRAQKTNRIQTAKAISHNRSGSDKYQYLQQGLLNYAGAKKIYTRSQSGQKIKQEMMSDELVYNESEELTRQLSKEKLQFYNNKSQKKASSVFNNLQVLDKYINKLHEKQNKSQQIYEIFYDKNHDDLELLTFNYDKNYFLTFYIMETQILNGKNIQNIFIFNDIYDSFIEYIQQFKNYIKLNQNQRVILFNLPGQANTNFNPAQVLKNIDHAIIVDKFIFSLIQNEIIKLSDRFSFFAMGMGGLYLATYIAQLQINCDQLLSQINNVVFVNCIIDINKDTQIILQQNFKINQEISGQNQELAYNYHSIIQDNKELTHNQLLNKIKNNSITLVGRQNLIQGLLSSHSIFQLLYEINVNFEFYFSQQMKHSRIYSVDRIVKIRSQFKNKYVRPNTFNQQKNFNIHYTKEKWNQMDKVIDELISIVEQHSKN